MVVAPVTRRIEVTRPDAQTITTGGSLLVDGGVTDADAVTTASNAILGAALATIELTVAGAVDAEQAWRLTCGLATAALPA